MSTSIFSFTRIRPYDESMEYATALSDVEGDWTLAQDRGSGAGRYVATFQVLLQSQSDVNDWFDWLSDHAGQWDTWLIKAVDTKLHAITSETPGGTVNGSNTDFTIASKYIVTGGTLKVYRDGVETAAFTLLNNYTTPTIRYDTAPTVSVGVDYHYYYPVRFAAVPPRPRVRNASTPSYIVRGVAVRAEGAGSHLV